MKSPLRPDFACTILLAALVTACSGAAAPTDGEPRVIVLGFDGLDYEVTTRLMAEGRMPNFVRLADMGSYAPLGTAVPPQSPVAWSNFITGMDAGGHGIYDFIHRDPKTMLPYLSTSRAVDPSNIFELGGLCIPLDPGRVELLRHGTPFWEVLEDHGIETTIIRIPANYPPSGSATIELSGMGTPDILGTYGTFSFFTSTPEAFEGVDVTGGHVYPAYVRDNVVKGELHGPDNTLYCEPAETKTEFTLYLDPVEPVARLVIGTEERTIQQGEWTDWIPFEFDLMSILTVPVLTVPVTARFYLRQVRPEFELYVTPLNIDPMDPAQTISTPSSYAAELARETGRYYTQGMPEDTKSLSEGVFSREEFLSQARLTGREILEQYPYVLSRFERGLLFYYFGNPDQVSHMMWRPMDPGHPAYDEVLDAPFKSVIEDIYVELDGVVGRTLDTMAEGTTLIVMSDHGFTSWRRSFHLNAWLREQGYLVVRDPYLKDDPGLFLNVDWARTRAYGLGINGLYINQRGRERSGIVSAAARELLMDEIEKKLLETIDPATGKPAVTRVYQRDDYFQDRGQLEIGPDMIIGYAKMTRGSNESALGEVGREILTDNTEPWSGDHCMDHDTVPGILLTNRELKKPANELKDLAAAILAEFGIDTFPATSGGEPGASR
jgi:predicted AlkP superfamily phosphohydrolase/phosphomutase